MAVRRWLLDLPTRVHLWTAEHELRAAGASDAARSRNLDLLRDYRRGRQFPQHYRARPAPCFVDSDGRHCAVAHLMACSGENAAVERISGKQNYARLREMDLTALHGWQRRCGLTVSELGRIQPTYTPRAEFLMGSLAVVQLLFVAPFALISIVVNLLRLTRSRLRTLARAVGLVVGSLLLLGVAAIAVIDLAATERPCGDLYDSDGVPLPDGGSSCGPVSAPWLLAGGLAVLGVVTLAAVWFNRRRGAVRDELLAA